MIHQGAAPSRDFASYLITSVTCFSEVSFLQNSVWFHAGSRAATSNSC